MKYVLPLLILFATGSATAKEGGSGPDDAASGTFERQLAAFPVGKYVMVQAFEENVRQTLEAPEREKQEKRTRHWNRFTFDLDVVVVTAHGKSRTEAQVVVRRVQLGLEGEKDLAYDSDGKPAEQAEILRKQFSYLVDGRATVDLAAFDQGQGFEGLNAVWDEFAKENPTSQRMAAANRENYGDSRLDRMFTRGLPVVFGSDAGRAPGRTRKLTSGETYQVELEILGLGREKALSKHSVEVVSVNDGYTRLAVTWAENGFNSKTDGGAVLMRGGDIQGRQEMTFHLASGVLVGLVATEERTDQSCGMDMVQRTRHATTVFRFSITEKAHDQGKDAR